MIPAPPTAPTASPVGAERGASGLAWRRLGWAVALATTIVLGSGNPAPEVPGSFVGLDKIVHFSVFGLLATLVMRADAARRWGRWSMGGAVLVVSVFGVSDELHQSFTPGRSMDYADWIADTLGAMVAVTAYHGWAAYRALLERRLWGRQVVDVPACASGPGRCASDGQESIERRGADDSAEKSHVTSRR